MSSRFLSLIFLLLSIEGINAQETISAQKERLGELSISNNEFGLKYLSSEEGFFSPNGPFIDAEARLFFYPTYSRDYLIEYFMGGLRHAPLPPNRDDYQKLISAQYIFVSQQGTISVQGNGLTFNYYSNSFRSGIFDWTEKKVRAMDYTLLPVQNGMVLQSMSQKITLSAEYLQSGQIKIRDVNETKSWLPTQPGGFELREDVLYRNGFRWSAKEPPELVGKWNISYLGRLSSGHVIWVVGDSRFFIATPEGRIEETMLFPWSQKTEGKLPTRFNYGLGPWGEFYILIAPPWKEGTQYYKPIEGVPAELVVVRNHLKYFGRLNDSNVRLRKEPNTKSEILGTYPAKTGFRILEKGTKEETIGGQKNVWYKVRLLDGIEGWFFGSFVHNLYDGPNGSPPPWPNVPDW